MTEKQLSEYAKAQAKAWGLTEKQYRQRMSEISQKADKTKAGFASMPKDRHQELLKKSAETRRKEG